MAPTREPKRVTSIQQPNSTASTARRAQKEAVRLNFRKLVEEEDEWEEVDEGQEEIEGCLHLNPRKIIDGIDTQASIQMTKHMVATLHEPLQGYREFVAIDSL